MSDRYNGPALLVLEDGSEVQTQATYWVNRPPLGLTSWSGSAVVDPSKAPMPQQAEIRLPNGDHGQVLITNMTMQADGNGPRARLSFTGNGTPPGEN
jgi:hypothetical protein